MSNILSKSLWILAILGALVVGINMLPEASDHPVPVEISSSIQTMWGYVDAMNEILPLDTLLKILTLSIGFKLIVGVLYPAVMWLWKFFSRIN